jgi:hypothetical protein
MEAVIANRAALPETASGFARGIKIAFPDEPIQFDMPIDLDAFAQQVLEIMSVPERDAQKVEADLRKQVDYFHANYQWSQRVAPWLAFITSLKKN